MSEDRSWAFVTSFYFDGGDVEHFAHYGSRHDCEKAVDMLPDRFDPDDGSFSSAVIRYPLPLEGRKVVNATWAACPADQAPPATREIP